MNWETVRLPVNLDPSDNLPDFIEKAILMSKYIFKGERRRELAWQALQMQMGNIRPDHPEADEVYEHGMQDPDRQGFQRDTDSEEITLDAVGRWAEASSDGAKEEPQDEEEEVEVEQEEGMADTEELAAAAVVESSDSDKPTPPPKGPTRKLPTIDDDGFPTVARTRQGIPLEDPKCPPPATQDDYTAVDMLEYHLYRARRLNGQEGVDELTRKMAKERARAVLLYKYPAIGDVFAKYPGGLDDN
ncbi:unnamed protein product, partial [Symbiodinium microadriaticum]